MTSAPSNASLGSPFSPSPLRSVSGCSAPGSTSSPTSSASFSDEVAPAVARLVTLLREIERTHDTLVSLGGQFTIAMVEAQREQRLSPTITQPVMAAHLSGQGHLAASRGSTIEGHKALERIARTFGIPFRMDEGDGDGEYGDSSKYPPGFAGATDAKPRIAA